MEIDKGICESCLDKVIDMAGGLATVATGYCPHLGNGYMVEISTTGEIQKSRFEKMDETESDTMRDRVTTALTKIRH